MLKAWHVHRCFDPSVSSNGSDDTYFFDGQYYPKAQANADFLDIADIVLADLESAPFPTTFDAFTPEAFGSCSTPPTTSSMAPTRPCSRRSTCSR
jgi:hypothetical protein